MAKYSENSINLRNSERSKSWRPTGWRPRRGRARCRAEQGLRASRAEMTPPPRSMAMRHGGGARNASAAFSAQNASGSEYRQNRSSVIGRSRKQCLAERNRGRHSRTRCSDASRGRMMPFARVEHGLPLRQRMLPSFPGAYPARPPLTAFSKRKCSHDRLPDGGGGVAPYAADAACLRRSGLKRSQPQTSEEQEPLC